MPRKRSHTHLAFYTNRCSYICHAYATFYPFSISVIYFAIQYVFESRDNDSFILIFYQAPTRLAPYKSERIIFVDNLNIHIQRKYTYKEHTLTYPLYKSRVQLKTLLKERYTSILHRNSFKECSKKILQGDCFSKWVKIKYILIMYK